MIIDAHQHFWKYDPIRDSWITDEMSALKHDYFPENLAHELDANGIDASIAVQADQSENETLFLLDMANRHDRVAGVVGWVDLRSLRLAERLQFFSQFPKLRGFRHIAQAEPDDRFLIRDDFVKGVAQLGQFGLAYDILIFPKQLHAALDLVAKLPDQRFVIDHLAKPEIKTKKIEPWAAHMRSIAQNKNVYCKLSGMVTETHWRHWKPDDFNPYLDVVFDAFGPDRLMFGSDWPVCLLAASYTQVKQIIDGYLQTCSAEDKDKIFGGNAIRFYRLKIARHGLTAQK